MEQVNGKFRTPSQLAAHAAFAAAHGGIPMFDQHPAQGNLFGAGDVLTPGLQLLAPLLAPLDGDSLFCDNGPYLTPEEHAALVAPLIGYLSPAARAVLMAQPEIQNVLAAPPAFGRAKLLSEAIAARGARPTQSCRPLPARSEPRPLGPTTARCFCAAGEWPCSICTLVNKSGAKTCAACDKPRPGASGMPWLVPFDCTCQWLPLHRQVARLAVKRLNGAATRAHFSTSPKLSPAAFAPILARVLLQPAPDAGCAAGCLAFRVCTRFVRDALRTSTM